MPDTFDTPALGINSKHGPMASLNVFARLLNKLLAPARRQTQIALEDLPDAPDLFRCYRGFLLDPRLKRRPGGWDYKGRFYPDYLTAGGASHAIARTAVIHCVGSGIDIGAGLWPLPNATPVDVWRGPGAGRNLDDIPESSQDYAFSSHCLEHVVEWREELRRWTMKLKPGGVVFLYLPHPECGIWEPGSPMVWDEHKWQPTPSVVKSALSDLGCTITASDDGPDAMMSFYVVARRG